MTLFHDTIQAAGAVTAAVANRVDLGDITLGAGAWVITRVWAHSMTVGTHTANMGTAGYIQIESEHCAIAPCQFLLEPQTGMGGTGPAGGSYAEPRKYVVNCPAPAGAVLNIYHVADATITTATAETIVTVEYARASPFPGGQVHMKCGEPSVTGSTSDGGVTSLTDIVITASKVLAVVVYAIQTTCSGDMGTMLMFEMRSDNWAEPGGGQRWSLNTQPGGDATNNVPASTSTLLVEVDAAFKSPNQNQTVSAEYTAYDAETAGPEVNWCLIYV